MAKRRDRSAVPACPDDARDATLDAFRAYRREPTRALRNQIAEQHLDLADFYATKYSHAGVGRDDLRQVALLAMVRAIGRFDPDRGVLFSTFASRTVDGELKRHLRDKSWAVRPPRAVQELHLQVRRMDDELQQTLGRRPTVEELAVAVGASVDHVLEATEASGAHSSSSIDRAGRDDAAEGRQDPPPFLRMDELGFGAVECRVIVTELLDTLPARDRQAIELRFFENLSQAEIAGRLGVSQSYLSRLLSSTLRRLRAQLGDIAV